MSHRTPVLRRLTSESLPKTGRHRARAGHFFPISRFSSYASFVQIAVTP